MSHENSQFDIPIIQLRESKTQPRVSLSREIGEAQITHTIFGKAKVRIIRKGDQARRTMILAAITVAAVAAVAWQGWFSPQQIEPAQNTAQATAVSAEPQASVSASQPESVVPPAATQSVKSEPVMPPATGINAPVSQRSVPQQPNGLKDASQKAAKPVAVQPKPAMIKPKPTMVEPPMAGAQQTGPARPLPVKRPVTPAVVTSPAAPASSPAAAAPRAAPPGREDAAVQSPIDDTQLSAPINAPAQ